MNIFHSKQFLLFFFAGGISALTNFSSRFLFSRIFSFELAVIFSYLIGMITAFILAKSFVFKGTTQSTSHSLFWFSIVNLVAVTQTYFISIWLLYQGFPLLGYSFFPDATAHGFGVIAPIFTSYIGHKYLSFKT